MTFVVPLDQPPINFTITDDWANLSVQWDQRLGYSLTHGLYEILHRVLESLDGVERVTMLRYSASIRIANHVTTSEEVVKAIHTEVFAPDGEFVSWLRRVCPAWTITDDILPEDED